jgi:hypothetical protein
VQDVDTLLEARNVEDPVLLPRVDSNLFNTRTDTGHRLPVCRLKSLLNPAKLESGDTTRLLGKRPPGVERGPNPENRLVHTRGLYKVQYRNAISDGHPSDAALASQVNTA